MWWMAQDVRLTNFCIFMIRISNERIFCQTQIKLVSITVFFNILSFGIRCYIRSSRLLRMGSRLYTHYEVRILKHASFKQTNYIIISYFTASIFSSKSRLAIFTSVSEVFTATWGWHTTVYCVDFTFV